MNRWFAALLGVLAFVPLPGLARVCRGEIEAEAAVVLDDEPLVRPEASHVGFSVFYGSGGSQLAVLGETGRFTAAPAPGGEVRLRVTLHGLRKDVRLVAKTARVYGPPLRVALEVGGVPTAEATCAGETVELEASLSPDETGSVPVIALVASCRGKDAGVRWHDLRLIRGETSRAIRLRFPRPPEPAVPPPALPASHPAIAREMVEWDWRLQDGIGTPREPADWRTAIRKTLDRGDGLVRHLSGGKALSDRLRLEWRALREEWEASATDVSALDLRWEDLWRRAHRLRRRIALSNPLLPGEPLLFAKRVPSSFSHQLTQYYGDRARPGGGIYVLGTPSEGFRCRELVESELPRGSYLHPEVSRDARRVVFAYAKVDSRTAADDETAHYHLFEASMDRGHLRQITRGPYDDFSPRYLPNGRILFVSTRRGGFHRCGRGPCPVYTLSSVEPDGSGLRVLSCHETHEWDPAVLNDGRVIYTRWDYVDRHAVHYQQLWVTRPDGSAPAVFYGNNTLNPVGVWEARPVPGSSRVMATAAAHHAMTAGSIILIDPSRGVDGLEPVARLTPDVLFPESESAVQHWHAPAGVERSPPVPEEEKRWPGHAYRSPFPLSEDFFLAAYSFDRLIGEPQANPPNQFGVYLVDRFGNKELLYRDPAISSLWPTPVRPRRSPPDIAPARDPSRASEGTFFVQDVSLGWPALPGGEESRIRRLRVVQVLPKSTPHINEPRVGLANASPGKQVLGTVRVEEDGSAYFRAPAGVPLSFQALDARGMAVQVMRSVTYLQAGETAGCIGCHEHRMKAPPTRVPVRALARRPSEIVPGPDGSKPFSYPLLVQPVLDRRCVPCHRGEAAAGGVVLTGEPRGEFSASYAALAPRVPISAWRGGDFLSDNSEPVARPGFFGARASRLLPYFLGQHEGVDLTGEELERIITWMDVNALFYGTFDPDGQARQLRGERIPGPALE